MSDPIIRVEGLGKRYRIGGRNGIDRSLPEAVMQTAADWARRLTGRRAADAAPHQSDFWALRDVSFDIQPGEVVGIIGQNGAGKSTLLKILSEITDPTEGTATIRGRIGSLLEVGTGFHPELSGRENIYLNGAILGMSSAEVARKFNDIVAFSEIGAFLDTPVKRYSSGMYTRLAFAVAAHFEPEVLIIDEVLAVGDAAFQKKCLGKMGDVARAGRTVLFVSHNLGAINRLCHRCVYLKEGRAVMVGPSPLVVRRYLEDTAKGLGGRTVDDQDNSDVQFTHAAITDAVGRTTSQIDFSDDGFLTIDYRVRRRLDDLHVTFRLYNDAGVAVLFASDTEYTFGRNVGVTEPGDYRATIRLPGHLLFPGRYRLDLIGELHRVRICGSAANCLNFEIVSTGELNPEEGGWGIIYPKLDWETRQVTGLEAKRIAA
ncbi:MAG: ABC transporter ATP-binding protein [Planctomycetes bacterium]|nr:ABC transporter ATP-binding protein [Planctomycetota bacterium]